MYIFIFIIKLENLKNEGKNYMKPKRSIHMKNMGILSSVEVISSFLWEKKIIFYILFIYSYLLKYELFMIHLKHDFTFESMLMHIWV